MPASTTVLISAMTIQERAGDARADDACVVVQRRTSLRTGPTIDLTPTDSRNVSAKTTLAVAEGEEEADRQRPVAVGHQLAGRVVDRRDVVGVEGVPHAQGVRGEADAEAERLLADAVVVRRDEGGEGEPAEDVQSDDHRGHRRDAEPFAPGQREANPPERGLRGRWPSSTTTVLPHRSLLQVIGNKDR